MFYQKLLLTSTCTYVLVHNESVRTDGVRPRERHLREDGFHHNDGAGSFHGGGAHSVRADPAKGLLGSAAHGSADDGTLVISYVPLAVCL